jgi:hypothetical protein
VHTGTQTLEAGIRDWIAQPDQDPKPLARKKAAEEILGGLSSAV